MLKRTKAAFFYYILRPMMNRFVTDSIVKCPVCGELLQKYDVQGFLHLADGDADCYGALGAGKGSLHMDGLDADLAAAGERITKLEIALINLAEEYEHACEIAAIEPIGSLAYNQARAMVPNAKVSR